MHSIRPRPICRAHNTFSPSVALWQHFVAPNRHLKSSFTTEATRSREDENVDANKENLAVELETASENKPLFRRLRTNRGHFSLNPNLYPKYRNNDQQQRQVVERERKPKQDAEKLLKKAYQAYNSAQDYEGVVVQPVSSVPLKESKYPWVPWVPKNRENTRSGEERLNLEIQAFHNYVRPSQAESVARKHVIEQVRQHVRKFLPNYVLEVFGSERTGVAFARSDIDLRLIPKDVMSDAARSKLPPSPGERARRRADLTRLHRKLIVHHKNDYLLPTIRWARYPLISLQDRASGLDVQVVLSNDTSTSREFMQRYMQEFPYLPQLYSVIKATLDVRGLSDVFRGGIGSYPLFMMVVASLKHKPHPHKDAAGALDYFLRFWGGFRAEEHGVSIDPVEFFAKSEQIVMHEKAIGRIVEGKTAPLPPWMLTLRDPADETNDLGRKTVAWKHVQQTYKNLSKNLRDELAQNTRVSLLARHVGPTYTTSQRAHRKKLTNYGRSLIKAGRQPVSISYVPTERTDAGAGADAGDMDQGAAARDLDELAAIARTIREGETVNKEATRKAEALDTAKDASQKGQEDEVNPWLKDLVKASDHKETGEAFSNLLGLDKKPAANKQEE